MCLVTLVLAGCSRKTDSNADLVAAVSALDRRITVARISAFPHRPAPVPADRSASPRLRVTDRQVLEVRAAAMRIVRATTKPTHDAAIAAMAAGDATRAASWLERLVLARPNDPALWSDLAAARFEVGTAEDDPAMHASALAAADAALRIDPRYAPALFNRALILDELTLKPFAKRAFEEYLSIDRAEGWADEARFRLQPLQEPTEYERWPATMAAVEAGQGIGAAVEQFPQHCRTHAEVEYLARWGEAHLAGDERTSAHWLSIAKAIGDAQARSRGEHLLADAVRAIDDGKEKSRIAEAHVLYRKARLLYRTSSGRVRESVPVFSEAVRRFRETRSPMAAVADYYRANALFDVHQTDEAAETTERLLATLPERYRALRAQLYWLRSTIAANRGEPYAALTAAQEASSRFRALGENENAASMELVASAALSDFGRIQDAHRMRRRGFASASRSGKPSLLERGINNAARDEVAQRRWAVAASLFALEIENPAVSALLRADALMWRAVARAMVDGGEPDLAAARTALGKVAESALQQDMEHELRLIEGAAMVDRDPERAAALLTTVIEFQRKTLKMSRMASAYVERGRAYRAAGRLASAERDFRAAIETDQRTGTTIHRGDLRDSFLGGTDRPYEEMLNLLISDGRLPDAVDLADSWRMRGFDTPATSSDRVLAPDTVLLHYTTTPRHTLLAIRTRHSTRVLLLRTTRQDLKELHRRLLIDSERAAAAHHLYEALVAPAAREIRVGVLLVIVPDPALADLPFAMLARKGEKTLLETAPIVYASSVMSFVAHAGEQRPRRAAKRAVIADPAFDPAVFPRLERLSRAAGDADAIRASTRLVGAAATAKSVLAALESSDEAHFATHAIADPVDAWKSLVVLAQDQGSDGALYLHQVAQHRLDSARLITLAACRTGIQGGGRGTVRSLARAFLAAGAHNVVGTLWDVDDEATSVLMREFYRFLDDGDDLAAALQKAQLMMMRSGNPRWSSPHAWAAVQLFGCNH